MRAFHLFLIPLVLLIALTAFASVSDADAEMIELNVNLDFNKTDGSASAEIINQKAGENVCTYASGRLTFTKSCIICFRNVSESRSLINFNDTSSQSIEIQNGSAVEIRYLNNPKLQSVMTRYSVIDVKSPSFEITGNGSLIISSYAISKNYVSNINALTLSCSANINHVGLYIFCGKDCATFGYGIVDSDRNLNFYKCNVKSLAQTYAISFNYRGETIWNMDHCTVWLSSGTRAVYCHDDLKYQTSGMGKVTVSYYINGQDAQPLSEMGGKITDYRYVWVTEYTSEEIGDIIIDYLFVILFFALFFGSLWFIFLRGYLRKRYKGKSKTVIINDVPEEVLRSHDGDYVDVNAESLNIKIPVYVKTNLLGESFAIYIDGVLYGYIMNTRSVIDAVCGKRHTLIKSVGAEEIVLIEQDITYISGMELTITKNNKGYVLAIKGGM